MRLSIILLVFLISSCSGGTKNDSQDEPDVVHKTIYYEPGMYGGWPANNGIWIWDNEILVGFTKGYFRDLGLEFHNMDRERPEKHLFARSLDGGETWTIEDPALTGNMVPPGIFIGAPRDDIALDVPVLCAEKINFTHPDFALTARTTDKDAGQSFYYYSYDRGRTWKGACLLPDYGHHGTAARTDYLVNGEDDCMIFSTATKEDGLEGRPMMIRTTDGGLSWPFVSWIGPEPDGFSIMPASVRLSENKILVTVRRREDTHRFISAYLSEDNGQSWRYLNNPTESAGIGSPPAMIKLHDGRVCMVYGYRAYEQDIWDGKETSDIRAVISNDGGMTWSRDYILRNDGSGRDIGYPRMVQRPDGKIVVVYYFMDKETGPERYIGATLWDPPAWQE